MQLEIFKDFLVSFTNNNLKNIKVEDKRNEESHRELIRIINVDFHRFRRRQNFSAVYENIMFDVIEQSEVHYSQGAHE